MSNKKQVDISKRSEVNTSVSMALLTSYRKALYSVKDFLDTASKEMVGIEDIETQLKISLGICTLGEKLSKNVEALDKLEDKVKKEERESISRRGGSETSMFED